MSAEDSHNTNLAVADTDDLERDIGDEVNSPPLPPIKQKQDARGQSWKQE